MARILMLVREGWRLMMGTAAVTLVLVFGAVWGDRFFSSNTFCLSCHSMSYAYEELKESPHFGALGADPECQDCHLPPQFVKRVRSHIVDGTRALIGEFRHDLSTIENFDKHRAEYAHTSRLNLKKWNSSPCRTCHRASRSSSEKAKAEHKRMETEGVTCIDCHQNLVHKEVPKEDLVKGMAEGRIVLKEDKNEQENEN